VFEIVSKLLLPVISNSAAFLIATLCDSLNLMDEPGANMFEVYIVGKNILTLLTSLS
jgi:hypothetical protein